MTHLGVGSKSRGIPEGTAEPDLAELGGVDIGIRRISATAVVSETRAREAAGDDVLEVCLDGRLARSCVGTEPGSVASRGAGESLQVASLSNMISHLPEKRERGSYVSAFCAML